jgi:hypothetical protein
VSPRATVFDPGKLKRLARAWNDGVPVREIEQRFHASGQQLYRLLETGRLEGIAAISREERKQLLFGRVG